MRCLGVLRQVLIKVMGDEGRVHDAHAWLEQFNSLSHLARRVYCKGPSSESGHLSCIGVVGMSSRVRASAHGMHAWPRT